MTITQNERQLIDEQIRELGDRIDRLDDQARDLIREADDLRGDLSRLMDRYPPLPQVWTIPGVGGHTWFSDGWRVYRDKWPGQYQDRNPEGGAPKAEGLAKMVAQWTEIDAPAAVDRGGSSATYGPTVILSSGAEVRADFWEETMSLKPLEVHSKDASTPIVFRDDAGVVACLMPIKRP